MKVHVDPDLCISCGACIDLCPDVYDWNDEGIAEVKAAEVPEDMEDLAHEAVESCPTDAISEESDSAGLDDEDLAMRKD